jgi:hypothetical protein
MNIEFEIEQIAKDLIYKNGIEFEEKADETQFINEILRVFIKGIEYGKISNRSN